MPLIELFDRPVNTTPSLSKKIIFGDGTNPEENMSFEDLINYINGGTIKKIYEIGDWNMDSTINITIVLDAVANLPISKIRNISVTILQDNGIPTPLNAFRNYDEVAGGVVPGSLLENAGNTQISLERLTGGAYDSNLYDSTSFNRGYIIIETLP